MFSNHPLGFRVLVADDHELTRFSLKVLLSNQNNLEVVGVASNGKEVVELVQTHYPDVVMLDLQMPVMDGFSAAGEIKKISPRTQIIAYSSLKNPQSTFRGHTAPIDLYCKKDIAVEKLIENINYLGERSHNRSEISYSYFGNRKIS